MAPTLPQRLAPATFLAALAVFASGCQRDTDATSAPVDAPSAAATPASPPEAPAAADAPASPTAFDCGGTAVQASFDGDNATLLLDGESVALATTQAASGARYEGTRADGTSVEFWSRGGTALLTVAGTTYPECRQVAPPAGDAGTPDAATTWRARGNEPFWTVEIGGGELRWTTMDSPEALVFSVDQPVHEVESFSISAATVSSDTPARALALTAEKTLCRDSMSGMPYPQTVTLRIDNVEYRGCGGEPMALLTANEWTITSIAGTDFDSSAPTLTLQADGSAGGFAGCNRWSAPMTLTGEGLGFARAAATMMACPEDDMRVEQAFLDALSKVTRHDFDEAGRLLLKAGDETIIVAAPAAPAAPAG